MSTQVAIAARLTVEADRAEGSRGGGSLWAPFMVTGFFAAALVFWYLYDHRVPSTDEAGHILNSLQYRELLQHARPFRLDWWTKFLSVNQFYTPSLYIFGGSVKLVLGTARWVDVFSMVVYSCSFTLATYGIARILTKSMLVATFAAIIVNLYPQIEHLSHVYLLDFPLAAAVTAGLWSLLWWREKPSTSRTAVACLSLAFACMSKQIAVTFLFLPGALCLLEAIKAPEPAQKRTRLLQLGAMVCSVAVVAVPWLAVNYSWIKSYSQENVANMVGLGVKLTPFGILGDYLVGLWSSMSPVLSVAFLVALVSLPAREHKALLPLYLSAVGGLLVLSCLTMTFPLDRYVASCLVCCAVVTACGAARVVTKPEGRFAVVAMALVCLLQFISFGFCPYPISALNWLSNVCTDLGVELREFRGIRISRTPPSEGGLNWGQDWTLEQIKAVDGTAPVWLNILPSQGFYNPHSFELLARERAMTAKPTTSRVWTIMGDKVDFDPKSALYFHWYLLKSGDQGNKLRDIESEKNYAALISFVKESGHFRFVAEHRLPDGSSIYLYRQLP